MKLKIKYLFGAAILLFIQACDKIEAPYREGGVVVSGTNDSSVVIGGDTIVFSSDTVSPRKKVLVEDYTGHLCGNCPAAGLMLNNTLRGIYGDKFIVVSVHAGFFAHPCGSSAPCPGAAAPVGAFATDFTNATSNAWEAQFAVSAQGNPNGTVDRIDFGTPTFVKADNQWSSLIQSQSLLPCDFKIRIINKFDSTNFELKTAVQTTFLSNKTGEYKLQLVLVEDSIIDWQEWYGHTPIYEPSFVHRDVLRAGINSDFGQLISTGAVTSGTVKLEGFTFTINSNFDPAHCKVVAFIYDASNYHVLQVEEMKVIE